MTKVPIMPLNVEELLGDPVVRLMGNGEVGGFWTWFLVTMWSNKGWLPADDKLIAQLLRIDVRRWRGLYKPKFEPALQRDFLPILGDIYRQPHLTKVWDDVAERIAQNRKRTAPARAKKAKKSAQGSSATEKKNGAVTQAVTRPVTETVTTPNQDIRKNSALQAESSSLLSQTAQPVARAALEGRSLPASPAAGADPNEPSAIHPADALTPEARADMQRRFAELSRSLSRQLGMADIPAYQHKPWEIADEPGTEDAEPDDTALPTGDRGDHGELPQPSGAASRLSGPEAGAEGQAGAGGDVEPGEDESPLMRALRTGRST